MVATDKISRAARETPAIRHLLDVELGAASSFEAAAQTYASILYDCFAGEAPLVRVYKTLPYKLLPALERRFVDDLLGARGARARDELPVLTLMGTRGAEPAWNDRRQSRGHLALPLLSAAFVQEIPMLARLLVELGLSLELLDADPSFLYRSTVGGLNGIFYVADAARARDAEERHIIPDADFVAAQAIKTVFGMGGSFLDGSIVATIVFCRESLSRGAAEHLATVVSRLKIAGEKFVRRGDMFSAAE